MSIRQGKESRAGNMRVCMWGKKRGGGRKCMFPLYNCCQRFQLLRCSYAPPGSPPHVTVTHFGHGRDAEIFGSVCNESNLRSLKSVSSEQVATPVQLLQCLIWTVEWRQQSCSSSETRQLTGAKTNKRDLQCSKGHQLLARQTPPLEPRRHTAHIE